LPLATILALIVPLAICLGWGWISFDPYEAGGHRPGTSTIWLITYFGGPFIGFAFLARPFGRRRDFDPETVRLCAFLSGLYWVVYAPAFYFFLMVYAIGGAGGT
jgi:Na+/proline symporter